MFRTRSVLLPICVPCRVFPGNDFSNKHMGVFGSGVTQQAKKSHLLKPCLPKLLKESAAFLRPGDSRKPVRSALPLLFSERTGKHKFASIDSPTRLYHTG